MRHRMLAVLVLSVAAACAPHHNTGGPDAGAHAEDLGQGGGHGGADAGLCGLCTSDLHQVLACDGSVATTCPADQGCAPGMGCVNACQAATANRAAIGCEYYTPMPPETGAYCYAAFVANTWGEPVTVSVDYAGASLDVDQFAVIPSGTGQATTYTPLSGGQIPVDGVAIVFLTSNEGTGCPGSRAAAPYTNIADSGFGSAFHITASAPVIVYDITPYGGGNSAVTSASLLEPTSAWDTSYIAVAMPQTLDGDPSFIEFVAGAVDTHVTIKPTVAVVGHKNVVAGGPAGTPITYTVPAGQFLKLQQPVELTGSTVVADQPIALFGGALLSDIPADATAADSTHQQIPPAHALGSRYAAVRYRNRQPGIEESPPWTLVGLVDGTTLTYDPPNAALPSAVGIGQILRFNASGPFVVVSQDADHPFYFAQHMTGCSVVGGSGAALGCTGDPEWVNVVPPAQYLARYVFFTDPTYPTTNLVFTRTRTGSGFADVALDCAGTLSGWKPVDGADTLEYTTIDLVNGNFVKQGNCDNGRHVAQSNAPFGLTVWGWGSSETGSGYFSQAVSYAYPAGQGVQFINSAAVPIQ